jgi:membrane-bound ClpP family serine protease
MLVSGPVITFGDDVSRFYNRNQDKLDRMVADVGEYYGADLLLKGDLDTYIEDYSDILQDIDADDLEAVGKEYNVAAFRDVARLYIRIDEYLSSLKIGVIACVAASIIALIGAQVRKHRIAGGVMVLLAAALTLIFSLVAGSIITMAPASLLLILGGVLQIAKPKSRAGIQSPGEISGGEVQS